jgi:hypothetical protein
VKAVAVGIGVDPRTIAERSSQPGHVGLQPLRGAPWGLLAPEHLDHAVGPDVITIGDQQQRQQAALHAAADPHRLTILQDLERPQDAHIHARLHE